VFQSYALFPHLDVEQNIGFGLRMQGLKKPKSKKRVDVEFHGPPLRADSFT
jgi:spermidine/putrescine transport system ATP-binding protein